jgi:hypothetical protein
MTPQSAQREVARALHHEKVIAARPWLIKAPIVRYALIAIRYKIVDGAGDEVTLHTWTIGLSIKAAVREWRKTHPHITSDDFDYTVISEPKTRESYVPQGDRFEPPDALLAAS